MGKIKLTNNQILAAIISNYEELKTIFSMLPKFKTIEDDEIRKARILSDLEYLINNGFKFNLTTDKIDDLFNSI